MKNIFEILKGFGIEIPEDKKDAFETQLKENYTPDAEIEKVRSVRDHYKAELENAQNALKEFEGVDVNDLKTKITNLNDTIEKNKADYEKRIAEMEFDTILNGAISDSGAKNAKAVRALLDLDALRESKNQSDDIKKALETVKSENDYMFKSDEPYQNQQTVSNTGTNQSGNEVDSVMRSVMGLPPEKN